jgi:hypothetical protein
MAGSAPERCARREMKVTGCRYIQHRLRIAVERPTARKRLATTSAHTPLPDLAFFPRFSPPFILRVIDTGKATVMSTNTIKNTELKNGMRVLIPAGGVISILGDAQPSRVSDGFVLAETSIGLHYFASDLTSKVLVSDEPAAENAGALAAAL